EDFASALQLRLGELLYPEREVPEPDRRAGRGDESGRAGRSRGAGAVLLGHPADVVGAGASRKVGGGVFGLQEGVAIRSVCIQAARCALMRATALGGRFLRA